MASCVVHAMQSIIVRSSKVIIIQYAEGERMRERGKREKKGVREEGDGKGHSFLSRDFVVTSSQLKRITRNVILLA